MDKNKANKAFLDIRICLYAFYNVTKWILASKRSNKFKHMMLDKYFGILMDKIELIRRKNNPDWDEFPKSPLDT